MFLVLVNIGNITIYQRVFGEKNLKTLASLKVKPTSFSCEKIFEK